MFCFSFSVVFFSFFWAESNMQCNHKFNCDKILYNLYTLYKIVTKMLVFITQYIPYTVVFALKNYWEKC